MSMDRARARMAAVILNASFCPNPSRGTFQGLIMEQLLHSESSNTYLTHTVHVQRVWGCRTQSDRGLFYFELTHYKSCLIAQTGDKSPQAQDMSPHRLMSYVCGDGEIFKYSSDQKREKRKKRGRLLIHTVACSI